MMLLPKLFHTHRSKSNHQMFKGRVCITTFGLATTTTALVLNTAADSTTTTA